jgi:hypothetical protein
MILQEEHFKTLTTDHLLSYRQHTYCTHPHSEKSILHEVDSGTGMKMYMLHKPTLLAELSTRPHRVRAKDRRKKK